MAGGEVLASYLGLFFFFPQGVGGGLGGWTKGGKEALQDVKEKEKAEGDGKERGRAEQPYIVGEARR